MAALEQIIENTHPVAVDGEPLNPADGDPIMIQSNSEEEFIVVLNQQIAELTLIKDEIKSMRADMAAIGTATVTPLKSMDDRCYRWDQEGVPVYDVTGAESLRAA
jgi:hypothetical protein